MTNSALDRYENEIRKLIEENDFTHREVIDYLSNKYGIRRGFSVRRLKALCSSKNIHRFDTGNRLSQSDIDATVKSVVQEVGPTYGRRMMTGLLQSRGYRIGERTVRSALMRANPFYQAQRQRGTERLRNPTPYYAEYAGHKLHLDQNEKLAEFGLTHVFASDGYSGKIVGASSMPVKNNVIIYDEVYRPACLHYGLWDQVRVDHGKEFYLLLYQQEKVSHLRTNTTRLPFVQTQSKQNHIAERVWVEINHRCTYPVKSELVRMKNCDSLDMEDAMIKYCVSEFLHFLSKVSIQNAIDAWNFRNVPGKGVPEVLFNNNLHCAQVLPSQIPPSVEVVQEYRSLGGHLTVEPTFGADPLQNDVERKLSRDREFFTKFPSFEAISSAVVNHRQMAFEQALLGFIDITFQH